MSNDEKKSSLSALIVENVSPKTRTRVLDEKLAERRNKQNHELNDRWESCCLTVDKRMCQYATQMTVLSGVMSFCIYQLITNDSCEAQSGYLGLLTLLLGLIVPSPSIKS